MSNIQKIKIIQKITADYYGISREDMCSPCRVHKLARARQVAMYISRRVTKATPTRIGLYFNKDHSTVCYALNLIAKEKKVDDDLCSDIRDLTKLCWEAIKEDE